MLVRYYKTIHISPSSLAGLSLAQFMHVMGGHIYINHTRLYDIWIFGNVIKYDNIVHLFASIVITLVIFDISKNYLHEAIFYNEALLLFTLILIVSGIGALNEIMEFGAVIFFHAQDRVGDYMNNAFDLFYNLLGATIGSIIVLRSKGYKEHKLPGVNR